EVAVDRRCGRHRRAHQMGTGTTPLPALVVAVRGGGAALAGGDDIGVHRQTARAARVTPGEAGIPEDAVQPLLLRLGLDLHRPGDDHGAHPVPDLPALDDAGRLPEVADSAVGAGADEDV